MYLTKRWRKSAASLCEEIGPEDGIDSRRLSRAFMTEKGDRKSRQLCKAAQRTLTLLLGGEFGDPLLQCLTLVDVTSDEAGASLLISLRYQNAGSSLHEDRILEKLRAVHGSLRAAVARSVNRKRVPALRFKLLRASSEVISHANS
jgi:ribosome-binding factor A